MLTQVVKGKSEPIKVHLHRKITTARTYERSKMPKIPFGVTRTLTNKTCDIRNVYTEYIWNGGLKWKVSTNGTERQTVNRLYQAVCDSERSRAALVERRLYRLRVNSDNIFRFSELNNRTDRVQLFQILK